MPETTVQSLLDRLPDLREGKMPPVDHKLAAELVESIFTTGPSAISGLIGLLREIDDGSDWKTRFAINALVIHAGAGERDDRRKLLVDTFHKELAGEHPAAVLAFVLSELRYVAGPESVSAMIPMLSAADIPLADAAAAVLVTIGTPAKAPLEKALGKAKGRQKELIEHTLLQLT